MVDRVGQRLGSYTLVRLLAHGGFGDVYLAEHIHLQTQAAVKVLHTQVEQEDIAPFRREASIVARLVHPHIVRVLEFAVEDSTPFLVMDYAPGGSLRKRHPRGVPLPLGTVVDYVEQIASGLQYAHNQNVIHRDVKPENMLVGKNNDILLSDFGIALVAQSSRYQTQDMQELAGTVSYMAPEQMQYQAAASSDQYSLAVVVYEWLSGQLPFHGSFTEIAVKHTLAAPPLLRERIPTLPEEVEAVIMRALAKDPKYRFPTIQDFATALREVSKDVPSEVLLTPAQVERPASLETLALSQETVPVSIELAPAPVQSTPNTSSPVSKSPDEPSSVQTPVLKPDSTNGPNTQGLKREITRRKVLVGLAGTAAAAAVGGGIALFAYEKEQQANIPTSTPAATSGTDLYTYDGHSDWVWSVAWLHNTNNGASSSVQPPRIASASGDKTVQLWDAFNGQNRYIYRQHTAPVYTVSGSPHGTYVASAGNDRTVQVWDASSGQRRYIYKGHDSWVWSLCWSPDGTRIASGSLDKTIQVWNALDGGSPLIYRGHSDIIHAVAWSPNGRYIASSSADGTVQVWNASDGHLLFTYQPYSTTVWSVAWSPNSGRIASGADNKTVQVWDALSGDHLYTYYGHTDFVYTTAWSPNGKRIASGGDDMTVQVWNADGSNPFTYTGHTASVRSAAWSPDGKWLASCSFDKTVQVWNAPQMIQ